MTTPTTTLTPEQVAEARRFLQAEAEANWNAEAKRIRAKLDTVAEQVIREALACPGVESAVKDDAGCYVTSSAVRVRYTGQRCGADGGFILLTLDGYTHCRPVKIRAKVRPGYKTGVRTFKTVRAAVKANRAFTLMIEAQVDAAMKARAAAGT